MPADYTPIPDSLLAELLELEAKATPGPWLINGAMVYSSEELPPDHWARPKTTTQNRFSARLQNDNGLSTQKEMRSSTSLIAQSRNSLRDLIRELQDKRQRERELVEALKEAADELEEASRDSWNQVNQNFIARKTERAAEDVRDAIHRAESQPKGTI